MNRGARGESNGGRWHMVGYDEIVNCSNALSVTTLFRARIADLGARIGVVRGAGDRSIFDASHVELCKMTISDSDIGSRRGDGKGKRGAQRSTGAHRRRLDLANAALLGDGADLGDVGQRVAKLLRGWREHRRLRGHRERKGRALALGGLLAPAHR